MTIAEAPPPQQAHQPILYRISVQDEGIGIPEEAQARIFETYTQADRSVARNYGGSGLGLTIVRNLVSLMGGSVQVQSEVSKGATFTLEIPFRPATSAAAIDAPNWRSLFVGQKALVIVRSMQVASNLCARLVQLGVQVLPQQPSTEGASVLFTDQVCTLGFPSSAICKSCFVPIYSNDLPFTIVHYVLIWAKSRCSVGNRISEHFDPFSEGCDFSENLFSRQCNAPDFLETHLQQGRLCMWLCVEIKCRMKILSLTLSN